MTIAVDWDIKHSNKPNQEILKECVHNVGQVTRLKETKSERNSDTTIDTRTSLAESDVFLYLSKETNIRN